MSEYPNFVSGTEQLRIKRIKVDLSKWVEGTTGTTLKYIKRVGLQPDLEVI
jgi:hypothetical protein